MADRIGPLGYNLIMSTTPVPEIDPATHLDLASLEAAWAQDESAPLQEGRLTCILARLSNDERYTPQTISVEVRAGIPEDRWRDADNPNPDQQIAVQGHRIATLIGNGQPLSLFGDNLTLDLDLSEENLPVGSLVEIGSAAFVVTPDAHTGCSKYKARFGLDALKFISARERRDQRLRGLYFRVVMPGEISIGDSVRVSRAASTV
jgi:hypothetical protein